MLDTILILEPSLILLALRKDALLSSWVSFSYQLPVDNNKTHCKEFLKAYANGKGEEIEVKIRLDLSDKIMLEASPDRLVIDNPLNSKERLNREIQFLSKIVSSESFSRKLCTSSNKSLLSYSPVELS